jgi:hypothetical protein
MDRDTLRAQAQKLLDACKALQAIFQQVHDLGGVHMPYMRHRAHLELHTGWTHSDVWAKNPIVRAEWPQTDQASHHRRLAVAAVGRVWERELPGALQALTGASAGLLEAAFPEGLPEGSAHGQSCGIEVRIDRELVCTVGWSATTSETSSYGLEGYGLDLLHDIDVLVDALLVARHLSNTPVPVDAPLWTVETKVACTGAPETAQDEHTLQALDPADALARVALSGANAVLCADRIQTLAIWEEHKPSTRGILSTIRTRAVPCTSKTHSTTT